MPSLALPLILALAPSTVASHALATSSVEGEVTTVTIPEGSGEKLDAWIEFVAPARGSLYVASSIPRADLAIEIFDTATTRIAASAGQPGRSACVVVNVTPGARLRVHLESPRPEALDLRLHVAPESEETLMMAGALEDALREGQALHARGETREARTFIAAVLDEARTIQEPESSRSLHESLLDVARFARSIGARNIERSAFEAAYPHAVRYLPGSHQHRVEVEGELARVLFALGDFAGARDLNAQTVKALETISAADDPWLLNAKYNLGTALFRLDDLDEAREVLEDVMSRWPDLSADDRNTQHVKFTLAGILEELGDLWGSRQLLEEVLESRSRTLPKDHPDLVGTLSSLAVLLRHLGELDEALALDLQVLEARERTLGPDHPELLGSLQNLALTRRALGDLQTALELEQQVFERRAAALPAQHPSLIAAKENLALTRRALGDNRGALKLQTEVLLAREQRLRESNPILLRCVHSLLVTHSRLGHREQVVLLARRALAGMRQRAEELRTEAPRVARALAANEIDRFAALLLHLEDTELVGPLKVELLESLVDLRDASISSADTAAAMDGNAELRLKRDAVMQARAGINDHSASTPAEPEQFEAWMRKLIQLARKRDRLEADLRATLEGSGVLSQRIDAEAVAVALPRNSLAITYLRYQRGVLDENGELMDPVDSLLAFVLTPSGKVDLVQLGPAQEIEQLVVSWRRAIGKPLSRGAASMDNGDGAKLATRLRQHLLDPLIGDASELEALYVVPDDFLYLVPFDALPAKARGADTLLGECLSIHTRVALAWLVSAPREPVPNGGILLLGGVDFDARPGGPTTPPPAERLAVTRDGLLGNFSYLPASLAEVQAIRTLYNKRREVTPMVLTGAEATKTRLRAKAPELRYLHIATHGWSLDERLLGQKAPIGTADRTGPLSPRSDARVRSFAPETLCGLALAGANRGAGPEGRAAGILSAEELAGLDLHACELAVLSGCGTSLGVRGAGQGVRSLQGALHAAGAQTTLTSLWVVDDRWTQRLMQEFYTRIWETNVREPEALWQAKMALREQNVPLAEWAGWVLTSTAP